MPLILWRFLISVESPSRTGFLPQSTADFTFLPLSLFAQGGEVHRPGDQARQCGGFVQVGGKDPSGRGEGHGCHRPYAVQTGLWPPRQPPQLRQAWSQSPGQHQKGESRLQLIMMHVFMGFDRAPKYGPGNIYKELQ